MGSYQTLELEREGPVLRIWLARPERRNAISDTMLEEVAACFGALQRDFDTRVVVLGGRGRSFCAGMDRRPDPPPERERPPSDRELRWRSQLGLRACRAIEDCEVPTVARVQGHAVGGGCCFALACDFRIAAQDAVFRVPEVELGIPLTWGAVPRLIHEVGAARAREILLLCEDVDGQRALEFGLAHRAVDAASLDAAVQRCVDVLVAKPELAVHMTKTQLRGYAQRARLADGTESDGDLLGAAARSQDFRNRFRLRDG